jgi:hypothetical protein
VLLLPGEATTFALLCVHMECSISLAAQFVLQLVKTLVKSSHLIVPPSTVLMDVSAHQELTYMMISVYQLKNVLANGMVHIIQQELSWNVIVKYAHA